MVKKYFDFINEELEILLESDVRFSEKFRKVLKKVGGNIADTLLDIENKDYPVQSNYFDITDTNDTISFTPDRKVKELIDKNANKWRYNSQGRNIHPDQQYQYLWDGLGLERRETANEPPVGTMGTIGKEFISPTSGKKFVVFIPDNNEYPPIGVNIEALRLGGGESENDFFRLSRQTIRVGRGVRSILNAAKIKVADKDVEEFVNRYKATIDAINDIFSHFDVVTGDDIAHWYHDDNYEHGTSKGTLGQSCMAGSPDSWFRIYTKNPDKVSMVIYKSPESPEKIKGRALVWKLDSGITFMDRIYTHDDSDIELFRQFAKKNGWYYKQYNGSSSEGKVVKPDGDTERIDLVVTLMKPSDSGDYGKYPYLDTLKYYSKETCKIKNNRESGDLELEDTEGGHVHDCEECDGDGRVNCEYCHGDGERDCGECDGDGKVDCETCEGTGEIPCSECDGEGTIEDENGNEIECPKCKGTEEIECPNCLGDGNQSCGTCDGDGSYPCEECDDGRVDCPNCS